MPLAQLIAPPLTPVDLKQWGFANVASHRDIIRRVMETRGIKLEERPLDLDPEDPASLAAFLNAHQDEHNDFAVALGIAAYDLSEVTWDDPADLARWTLIHYQMHAVASALLGVS